MEINNQEGELVLSVVVDDNSYRNREIMGDNTLTLYFSLAEHVEIPVGAYTEFQGEKYVLMRPEALKMKHSRYFEYTVTMQGTHAFAEIWKFRNTVDGRLKFSLTAKPKEHLQMLVDNMNRRGSGWEVGDCIDDVEHTISYDHAYCKEALGQMADEFETEYEISGKKVSLKKVEYNKNSPLPLSYGKGNGFKPELGRSNTSDTPPVEVLFVQGGDTNIDRSKYPEDETLRASSNGCLILPAGKTIGYDGVYFEDEAGYNASSARYYKVDSLGLSIYNTATTPSTYAEDSLDRSEDYPKRVGTVSEVTTVKSGSETFYDFIDDSIPSNLDYEKYLIDGETMTVIFQSGELAGKEFEVTYVHEAKKVNGVQKKARRFELVPQEIDGVTMPGDSFIPKPGDTYAVFGVMLPNEYIQNDEDKSGASWDMFRTAVQYLFENEEQKFTFTGELDGIWAKKDWDNIGGKIILGGYIKFTDERFQKEGVLVRITGIKDYINKPHSPKIELSNETITPGFSGTIKTIESQEVLIEEYKKDAIQFTKRRFRDAKETMDMLETAMSDNFTSRISPVAVETMAMLVGDERLQFRFVKSPFDLTQCTYPIKYDAEAKKLICEGESYVQHLTLGISSLSNTHKNEEYHVWSISGWESAYLEDSTKSYYLYIVCDKTDLGTVGKGEFNLSGEALSFETGSAYNLLVGVLNSEYDGERSFVTLYGFTEILPGRITTDRIVSGDGTSYFDMVANAMKLGDSLDFNSAGDGVLKLKGTIVQSQGGEAESPIGCFRGAYNETYTYYNGDEVTYSEDATKPTTTYRCISKTPITGIVPTDEMCWQVVAQGSVGISPNTSFKSFAFLRSDSVPSTPTGGSYSNPIPDGWSDGIPEGESIVWMSARIFSSDGKEPQESAWSTPKQMTDTADFDVEFSSEINPSSPSGHPNQNKVWSDKAGEDTIWMATSTKQNGIWGDWQVFRVKGENGEDGTSISIKGSFVSYVDSREDALNGSAYQSTRPFTILIDHDEELDEDCVVMYCSSDKDKNGNYIDTYTAAKEGDGYIKEDNGHLYMRNGTVFVDAGIIRGDKGDNGSSAYVHIKYANSTTENDWTDNNGETPGAYIGIYTDNNPTDRLNWSLYTWTKWKGEDGFGYEYVYKRTTDYVAPDVPETEAIQEDGYVPYGYGWTDNPTGVSKEYPYEWVCYRKKTNGVWSAFIGSSTDSTKAALWAKYGQDGEPGISPNTSFKSIVFIRSTATPVTPTGGSYSSPVPDGWSDGIPSGDFTVWMSSRVFSSDGKTPQQSAWTTPQRLTSTADLCILYSSIESPSAPAGYPNQNNQWSKEADETSIWMATSKQTDGVWGDWQVFRVKGENGEDGDSVSIKGTCVDKYETDTDAYQANRTEEGIYLLDYSSQTGEYHSLMIRVVIGNKLQATLSVATIGDGYISEDDGHLYIADNEGWTDAGKIQGEAGDSAYVHIKYANSTTEDDWTDNNGETPGAYIGIYADNNAADKLDWSLYKWTKWQGEDGFGYEYIYKRTDTSTAPDVPSTQSQEDDYIPTGWTDNPTGVSQSYPYEWVCYRKKTGGVWGAFIGSSTDSTKAALWAKYGEKGEDGCYTEYRYAVNGSKTDAPSLSTKSLNPSGWTTKTYGTVSAGYYLWMTFAVKTGDGSAFANNGSYWATPVRISPVDGTDGKSPALVYRGVYSDSTTYYGTDNRVDAVKYEDTYYIARVDAGIITDVLPTDTSKWNPFGASFDSVATGLLLAEFAYIENLGVRDLKTAESGRRVHISSEDNAMTVYDDDETASIQIAGKTVSDKELFGGANLSVSPSNVSETVSGVSNMQSSITVNCGSFDFTNEGTFSGSATLFLSGTLNRGTTSGSNDTQFTRTPGAKITVYLDDKITLCSISTSESSSGIETVSAEMSFSKPVSSGTHKITATIEVETPYLDTDGSMTITAKATFGTCKATANIRKSLYFANGNAVGCSSSQYIETVVEDGKLLHKMESGNAGFEFGSDKARLKINGTWYTLSVSGTALKLTAD